MGETGNTNDTGRLEDAFTTVTELLGIVLDNDSSAFTKKQAKEFGKAFAILERHVKGYCSPHLPNVGSWADVKRALEAIPDTDATTTERFWDCECDQAYIHSEGDGKCSTCAKERETQPDSRLREIMLMLMKEAEL